MEGSICLFGDKMIHLPENQLARDIWGEIYIHIEALASALGVSRRTLYREIERGRLEAFRIGDHIVKSVVRVNIDPKTSQIVI